MNLRTEELLRSVKHDFMSLRNGIVADVLRRGGLDCYRVIFGLNLPQLRQVADRLEDECTREELACLADALWADSGVRCSRLLACDLYGRLDVDPAKAAALAADCNSREESQVLALRLRRP